MERYQLLRWAQGAFDGFRLVPPGTGICHQVNLEYLSRLVFATEDGRAFCDTLVGTDSHTIMVNGLGVLGWGVGGIEAEAAMLGQPLSMLLPPVVGLRISGEPKPGITATDVVLTVTELLRDHGVVGAFVECYGPGVAALPLETRATIGNMSPEYGATCTMFPIDQVTARLPALHRARRGAPRPGGGLRQGPGPLARPGRARAGLLRVRQPRPGRRRALAGRPVPAPGPGLAGRRPATPSGSRSTARRAPPPTEPAAAPHHQMTDGDVVIAAITSCTNTSNPQVMVGAGLLAKKAVERGLRSKPWVKTSLAPGLARRHRLPRARRPHGAAASSSASTSSATAAPPASATPGPLLDGVTEAVKEGDLSVAVGALGQPQLRGPHPPRRAA